MAAAPPTTPSTCTVQPAPSTWTDVPPADHERLNAVPLFWNSTFSPMDMAELVIGADGLHYVWQIAPMRDGVVTADQLERLAALRHVEHVECDTNVRTSKLRGAVCVYVRAAAADYSAWRGSARSTDVAAPLSGSSYTAVMRASCAAQLDNLCKAASAALR